MVDEIFEEGHGAPVPEEDAVVPRDLLDPLHHQAGHVLEVAGEMNMVRPKEEGRMGTYLFPSGSCLGLMSAFLKWAKNSSTGLAEYECGAVKNIGSWWSS